jgi:hypothetical protein
LPFLYPRGGYKVPKLNSVPGAGDCRSDSSSTPQWQEDTRPLGGSNFKVVIKRRARIDDAGKVIEVTASGPVSNVYLGGGWVWEIQVLGAGQNSTRLAGQRTTGVHRLYCHGYEDKVNDIATRKAVSRLFKSRDLFWVHLVANFFMILDSHDDNHRTRNLGRTLYARFICVARKNFKRQHSGQENM